MLQSGCLCKVYGKDPFSFAFYRKLDYPKSLLLILWLVKGGEYNYLSRRSTISPRLWKGDRANGPSSDLLWKLAQWVPVMTWLSSRWEGARVCKPPLDVVPLLLPELCGDSESGLTGKLCACSRDSLLHRRKSCAQPWSFAEIPTKFCTLSLDLCFNIKMYKTSS